MKKLLPIVDAFRTILRSTHPEREDLQQIDSYQWFHDRKTVSLNGRIYHDQADEPAYAALDLLNAGVKGQKIRVYGCLNGALAADIDPIDAREGELHVFAAELKIYESKDTSRTSRKYTVLHVYADDLALPKDDGDKGNGRRLTGKTVQDFVDRYFEADPNPTLDGLRTYAKNNKIIGGRELYEPEYQTRMKQKTERPYRSGRRTKVQSAKI
jgi:hypothetical protein